MSVAEVVFAVQKPRYLVEEYVRLIAEFGLASAQVYQRCALEIVAGEGELTEPSASSVSGSACGDMDTQPRRGTPPAVPTSPQANNDDE